MTLEEIIALWDSDEGKPYKGRLIDWYAYQGDGIEPPKSISCMCAQGQVLHLLGGWTPRRLHEVEQADADRETAKLLGISVTHAVLLRYINDRVDGAPSIVLTNPEKVLGDQAHIVLAFWRHLDRMAEKDWDAARDAHRTAAAAAAWAAARDAEWDAAWAAAWASYGTGADNACAEIQGARILREQGKPFFFLPLFGFADPEAVLAADIEQRAEVEAARGRFGQKGAE